MKRNRRIYQGRYFKYFIEERSTYPYTAWIWVYGMVVYQCGETRYLVTGTSKTQPNPFAIFPNIQRRQDAELFV